MFHTIRKEKYFEKDVANADYYFFVNFHANCRHIQTKRL